MASSFLSQFSISNQLHEPETALLAAADVRSPEDVDSLVRGFPSLASAGIRLPVVSNAAKQMAMSAAYSVATGPGAPPLPPVAFGAAPPPGVAFTIGAAVGLPTQLLGPPPVLPPNAIDL